MTTSSARPDRLWREASLLSAESRELDDLARTASAAANEFAARCPDTPLEVGAPLQARLAAQDLGSLATAVGQVATAFAAADRSDPAPVVRLADLQLAQVIAHRWPGLSTGTLVEPIQVEAGRRLAEQLRHDSPDRARRRLDAAGRLPPAAASELLRSLGSDGLTRLLTDAEQDMWELGLGRSALEELRQRLAQALAAASSTVVRPETPDEPVRVSPGGLDLEILLDMGQDLRGRAALRALVPHLQGIPSPVIEVLAASLLAPGRTAREEWRAREARFRPPGGQFDSRLGDIAMLQLLGADPLASVRFERSEARGPSRTLSIVVDHAEREESAAVAAIVRNVTVVAVERGWAQPWTSPSDKPDPLNRRVLQGLVAASIRADQHVRVGAPYSRMLADVVDLHPAMMERAGQDHDTTHASRGGTRVPELTVSQRFWEVLSRDVGALERAVRSLLGRQILQARAVLDQHPPGTLAETDLWGAMAESRSSMDALTVGADAAGRRDHPGKVAAIALASMALRPAAGWAASAAGPAAPVAAKVVGLGLNKLQAEAIEATHDDDDREDAVKAHPARAEALIAADLMAADPNWSKHLKFPDGPGNPPRSARELARLDVIGSKRDAARFFAWLELQEPVVRLPLGRLPGSHPASMEVPY